MTEEIQVTSVLFGQDAIRLEFLEQRHQTDKGGIEQSLTVSRAGYEGLIEDIQEVLVGVIEQFLVDLRNPPDEIPVAGARARLRDRSTSEDNSV